MILNALRVPWLGNAFRFCSSLRTLRLFFAISAVKGFRARSAAVHRSNSFARVARSASRITIASPETEEVSGIGLHPPGVPTDCELMGDAQFLHTSPFCPLKNPAEPQISQASNTATTFVSGF